MKYCFTSLCCSAVVLAGMGAAPAMAGNSTLPLNLPQCLPGPVAEACHLPVRDAGFDDPDLSSWVRNGHVGHGGDADGNNRYVTTWPGSSFSQPVYAHAGINPANVSYTLRFRARSESGEASVSARLYMSDSTGTHTEFLGQTQNVVGTGEWKPVELTVNGKAFAAPAHVLVEIGGGAGRSMIQFDDVSLVQSTDAEAISR